MLADMGDVRPAGWLPARLADGARQLKEAAAPKFLRRYGHARDPDAARSLDTAMSDYRRRS